MISESLAGMSLKRQNNTLPLYGNKESMNLNTMILTNIRASPYFKTDLFELKTFHEVVDEIFYKVSHLEPWEKNSRKLAGQVGMCAGVRGVGAGGIVSTPYCILYKLFTLKLTRRQVMSMLNHVDSPYIRGLGFMYVRYSQPPSDFWDWFEPYIFDPEEIDLKAGSGYVVTVGEMVRSMLTKLDWFGTLFPRIPVNVQKDLDERIREAMKAARAEGELLGENGGEVDEVKQEEEEEERARAKREQQRSRERGRSRSRSPRQRSRERRRDRSREHRRERSRERRRRSTSREQRHSSWERRYRRRQRSRSPYHRRSRSQERRERRHRSRSRERR